VTSYAYDKLNRRTRFSTLHLGDLALCFGAGLAGVVWFELFKRLGEPNR